MTTIRHTIARIGLPLPGAGRAFALRDPKALTAAAWPVPVHDTDGVVIGRALGLVAENMRVDAVVEYFTPTRPQGLIPAVAEADLRVRDGDYSIANAVIAALTAAPTPPMPTTDPNADTTLTTDPSVDPAARDNQDTFTVTEAVTVNLDLPIAPPDTPWDEHSATARVAALAEADGDMLSGAFLYHDPGTPGDTPDDYQFPVADVIDNQLMLVPVAIAQAAALIDAGGPTVTDISDEDMQSLSDVLDELFAKVAAVMNDDAGTQGAESDMEDQAPEMAGGGADALGGCVDCGDPMLSASAMIATTVELPIAADARPWDGGDAESRVLAWATENGTVSARKLSQAYLWRDPTGDPRLQSSYRLPVADVINGQLTIVPNAVRAATAALGGARGGVKGLTPKARRTAQNNAARLMGRIRTKRRNPAAAQQTQVAAAASTDLSAFAQFKRHLNPPDEFFAPLELPGVTPITVTAAGEVYGHVADWKECHASFAAAGVCIKPPRSGCGYCRYHNGSVVTASGAQIRTGAYCVGGGHAPVDGPGSDIAAASAHYDNVAAVPARGVMREDEYGPYFHGALTPGATDEQIYAMLAFPPSGDWRPPAPGADIEMVAVTAVNTPGFLVRNNVTASADGDVTAVILTHTSPYVASHSTKRQIDANLEAELTELRREVVDTLAASIGRTRYDELAALTAAVHG